MGHFQYCIIWQEDFFLGLPILSKPFDLTLVLCWKSFTYSNVVFQVKNIQPFKIAFKSLIMKLSPNHTFNLLINLFSFS